MPCRRPDFHGKEGGAEPRSLEALMGCEQVARRGRELPGREPLAALSWQDLVSSRACEMERCMELVSRNPQKFLCKATEFTMIYFTLQNWERVPLGKMAHEADQPPNPITNPPASTSFRCQQPANGTLPQSSRGGGSYDSSLPATVAPVDTANWAAAAVRPGTLSPQPLTTQTRQRCCSSNPSHLLTSTKPETQEIPIQRKSPPSQCPVQRGQRHQPQQGTGDRRGTGNTTERGSEKWKVPTLKCNQRRSENQKCVL
ncbi:hypothetical protein CB1_000641003 [Camelus ferus]|nr:hypothetical protein CB1_000641003 [Camelus ferus]